jgi:hypothetical protein
VGKKKPLTERDLDVLGELAHQSKEGRWLRPMDIGGTDASHHSATLNKLVSHGYAKLTWFGTPWKPRSHKRYLVTDAGKALDQDCRLKRRAASAKP